MLFANLGNKNLPPSKILNVLILCFDKDNNFLSWTDRNGILINCEEHPYRKFADELVISYHTVKNHVQNIYTKCGVKSRFQLCKLLKNVER